MEFLSLVLVVLVIAYVMSQGLENPLTWVVSNPGAWKGIKAVLLAAALFAILAGLIGCANVSMVAGVDHHYDGRSPQCRPGSSDEHTTSNIAFRKYYSVADDTLAAVQWQHHSCAFGSDAKEYNSVGIYFEKFL